MEKSIFLELSLPNRDDQEDSADINVISENFRIIDSFAKGIKNDDVSNQQVSNALKGKKNDTKIYVSNDSQPKIEPDYSKMLDNSEDCVGYEATYGFHTVLSFDKIAGEYQTVRFTDGGYWETYMLADAEIAVGEVLYIGSDEVGRTCLFRTKPMSSDGFEAMLTVDDVSPLEHTFGLKIFGRTRESENLIDSSMLSANSNVTILNGIVTQITADSSEGWIKCTSTNNGTYISVLGTGTKANGVQSITFTKDDTFNQVNFGIGGTQRDTMVRVDVSHLTNGTYTIQANFTNITQGSISWKDMMINKGETVLPYEPFFEGLRSAKVTKVDRVDENNSVVSSFFIPKAVQALDGYGEGNPDNAEEYNAIILENGNSKYVHKGDIKDNVWVPLATPITTDISDLFAESEGVKSIYPVTTLICDAGANMEVKYNRDINKAFADLESRIAAILG